MEEAENEESSKVFIEALSDVIQKLSGTCPDHVCNTRVDFLSIDETVTCSKCLQTHVVDCIINRYETDSKDHCIQRIFDFGQDFVKVDGLSNFQCKLLSPFLTTFGMNKSGNAVPLQELAGHTDTIDCGKVLGNRSFKISPHHVQIAGYGKDQSGSLDYLSGLLEILKDFHGGEERLLPIHVDGDGHCLVHALSRALTGRELFWHPLRKNLFEHLKERLTNYAEMFRDFHDDEDFQSIIKEANPDAATGMDLTAGLGNIHIFALSNVLKRPIMLLDSPQKVQNAGDYTGLFLPVFCDPSECKNKSPICIAWSGGAHNHFVPLVPIEGKALPTIPSVLIPQIWGGVSSDVGQRYLTLNEDGSLTVCDGKPILIKYLQKLSGAMERKFSEQHMVSPTLVEDCGRYVYKVVDNPALQPRDVISLTRNLALNQRLFRCLNCNALSKCEYDDKWFKPGGYLYQLAIDCHQKLESYKLYSFPWQNLACKYNQALDRLLPVRQKCHYCGGTLSGRPVHENNKVVLANGDKAGTKFYWDGTEYDNAPVPFNVKLTMYGQEKPIDIPIVWFHGDSNPRLNSEARTEAERVVNKYFSELPDAQELIEVITNSINEKCRELDLDGTAGSPNGECTSSGTQQTSTRVTTSKNLNHSGTNASLFSTLSVTANDHALSSSSTQSACKRKSNGQPSEVAPNISVPKQPAANSKITVKISQLGGETKTVRLEPNINMADFQEKIEELFGVALSRQILKHGFPPRILQAPSDGGPIGLKAGDKITLQVKSKESKSTIPQSNSETMHLGRRNLDQTTAKYTPDFTRRANDPIPSQLPLFSNLLAYQMEQDTKKEELKKALRNSEYTTMWELAMTKPELFHPGGVFYEQFKNDIGLIDGQHCHLPLLEGLSFRYSQKHDRVEACFEPHMDHYPIDEEISRRYRKFLKVKTDYERSLQTHQPLHADNKTVSRSRSNSAHEPPELAETPKPASLAPGYHTVGDKPTELSEKDITLQRESIQQMVNKLHSKQSSS